MASYDHNSTAIADSYAKTLFELTEQARHGGRGLNQFRDFVAYMQRDADFAGFMTSHAVDSDRRGGSARKALSRQARRFAAQHLAGDQSQGRGELVPVDFAIASRRWWRPPATRSRWM
jgi:F0F1-type ATP synthase delta subunit